MPIKILLIVLGTLIFLLIIIRILRKFIHFPAPFFLGKILDSNHRRRMQKPEKIIERSGIKKGMKILEIGCGSGAFTTFTARAVGGKGLVYALDIQPKMLEQLRIKLKKSNNRDIKNVKFILGSAYSLPFADNFLDLVYMITVFQEIPDKAKTLKR